MYVHRYANDSRDSGTSRSSAPPLPPVPSGHRATRGSTYLVDCSGAGKCGKKQQKKKRVGHSSAGKPGRRLGGVRLSNMRRERLHDGYWVWGKGRGGEGVIRLQFSLAVAILRAGEREEDRCDISPPLRLSTSVRSAIRYRVLIRV